MFLLGGDSIAVGMQAYGGLHPGASVAQVGIGSTAGAARIERRPDERVVVSLGANDGPDSAVAYRRAIRRVLAGRQCVVWVEPPRRQRLVNVLHSEDRRWRRLHVVSGAGVARADGVHPTPKGYRVLAERARKALRSCRRAQS